MAIDLDQAIVERIAADKIEVPPYPDVAIRLNGIAQREDFNIKELVDIVKADQTLAAATLRLANSAAHARGNSVTGLPVAVSRIGAHGLVQLAFSASMGKNALRPGPLVGLRYMVWRHALTSAVFCGELSEQRSVAADDAFMCGLLHDFGKVVALACLEQIIGEYGDLSVQKPEFWLEILERYHVELGLVTATRWNLPALITDMASCHHNPEFPTEFTEMRDLVVCSDAVVGLLDQEKHVGPEQLAAVPQLRDETERDAVARLLPVLPLVVAAYIDMARDALPSPQPKAKEESLVAPAEPMGADDAVAIDYTVTCVRGQQTVDYIAQAMSLKALWFHGTTWEQENALVKLTMEAPDGPFDVHVKVVRCAAGDDGVLIEVAPFALGKADDQRWTALFHAAKQA